MKWGVITLFPTMVADALAHGVIGKAVQRGLVELTTFNPRAHATDRHAPERRRVSRQLAERACVAGSSARGAGDTAETAVFADILRHKHADDIRLRFH